MTKGAEITFEPPGPGSWMLDTTHHGRRPLTRYMQPLYLNMFAEGFPRLLEKYGLPLEEFRAGLAHGCFYVRPMGIGEPEKPGKQPPAFVLNLISRVHPELRRRNRIVKQAWEERRWRQDVDDWFGGDRDQLIAINSSFQAVDPAGLDDEALIAHLAEVTAHLLDQTNLAFETHGGDLIPVGDYLAHCARWGIDAQEASALLRGSSPASIETVELLVPVARARESVATPPASMEALRALGPDVDEAVGKWLALHGWRLLASDDFDSPTLSEQPDLQLRALLAASTVEATPAVADDDLRSRVPPEDRALFGDLLAEARYGLQLRDDNVGVRWNWPAGLVRRALLEAGRRLVGRGTMTEDFHVLELDADEITALLRGAGEPDRDEITARWRRRDAVIAADPPDTLGPESAPPPVDAFPAPLARATAAILATVAAMEGEPSVEPLAGSGVGQDPATGRALVAASSADAFERLSDGDILVAPYTGPAWNSLLPMLAGIVVEECGPMCHAAIVTREFGIPALVGVTGATDLVPDEATVNVDPTEGRLIVS